MKTRTFLKAMGLAMTVPMGQAFAQIGSGRPIRMIVPLPAGTSNDTSTRVMAPAIGQLLGQQLVIDNKAGASGVIGTMDVVRAVPDGSVLMCGSLSPLATNLAFVKGLPYDPRRDLTPIAGSTLPHHVLVVKASSPIRTFADFIAYAKAHPGKLNIGYSTSTVQLQIASLNRMAGIDLMPVPYKGVPPAVTDVIGGVLDATMGNPGPTIGFVKSGQLRALAITAIKRNPFTPEIPTIAETLPGFDFPSWNAYVGPAGMSKDLVSRVSGAIAQAQKRAEVIQMLGNEATLPLVMGPEELKTYMDAEAAKYLRLAREAGIQPE